MALPWIKSDGMEAGATNFTAISGTLIGVVHYTELARQGMAPYRGSYALRIKLAGGTTSQFIREDTAFDDLVATTRRFVRFYFYLGKDLVMANADRFSLFEAESTVNTTTEVTCGIVRNGANILFFFSELATGAGGSTFVLGTTVTALGKWYCAELNILLDSGVGDDGTIAAFIDDASAGTTLTALDQSPIVDVKFGVLSPDAGTSGTVLIDDIIYDDTQIFRDRKRYRDVNAHVTFASDHPIVGPGKFAAAVTGTVADAVLSLFDSDGVPDRLEPIAVLRNLTVNEFVPGHDIFEVNKGLYTTLTGTGAFQAFISIDNVSQMSDATTIQRGLKNGAPRV